MSALHGQRVCVIGGTAGMGRAIARQAVAAGAEVVLTGRDSERANRIASEIGANVKGRALDVLDSGSIETFFNALGPVDHLVTTAATVRGASFKTGALADARHTFEGKFWSQYLCARHAQVRRSILLFSGALSRRPRAGLSAVTAVNAAIEGLGRALAIEVAPVRVNVLSPGLVQGTDAYAGMPTAALDGMVAAAAARLPVGLVGGPDSIATIALALLVSDYVSGAVVDVDGGGLLV